MRRALLLLLPSLTLSACCTGFLGTPPGLSHPPPKQRPGTAKKMPKPPGGAAIEGESVEVEGVGHAIVIATPTPDAAASPIPTPSPEGN